VGKDYTKDDLKEFAEKDLRIVRQNAMSHATHLVVHCLPSDTRPDTVVDVMLALADRLVGFVYGGMTFPLAAKNGPPSPVGERLNTKTNEGSPGIPKSMSVDGPPVAPPPSKEQHKILLDMAAELAKGEEGVIDFDLFVRRVYLAFGKYPSSMASLGLVKKQIVVPFIAGGECE
jgi:hypothetical protein